MNNAAEVQDIEVLPPEGKTLKLFSEFDKGMAKLEKDNKVVFDLTDKKGMEEAKAHVRGVKKVRTALEKARKAAKANAIAYGRAVDTQAKEIESKIDVLVLVHEGPIKEVEQAELDRINAHEAVISDILERREQMNDGAPRTSENIQVLIDDLSDLPTDGLEEFEEEAVELKSITLSNLKAYLERTQHQEEKDAKLAKLEAEAEAGRKAIAVAEAETLAARQAVIDVELREKQQEQATERLEKQKKQDAIDAQEAIENAAKQAREGLLAEQEAERKAEEDRIAAEKAAEEAELERIANDVKAQAEKLEREKAQREAAVLEMGRAIDDHEVAIAVVDAILNGEIPHVSFTYE